MTRGVFGARRVTDRTPQTVVSSVDLPHRASLYHPQLGVLEVETSVPADQFSFDDVAATREEPRRWSVGGAVKGLSATEVRGDEVLEAVNHAPSRREPNHRKEVRLELWPADDGDRS